MTQSGSVVEILVQTRGSQLVGDHASGATTLLVDDPTPFDDAGGQVLVDGTAYTFTAVSEVPDTVDPAAANAQLAITPGLVSAVSDLSPVEMWSGDQVLDDLVLIVATGDEGDPPVPVTVSADQRAFWEARLGPVEPPVAVVLSDDLSQLLDAPGWTPSINGAALVGFPDPVEIAVDPPATSPAIISVTGSATALTVYTEPVLPTTLLDYYVNGVLVAADQRSTIVNLTTDGTNPLAVDTDYTVTVQAHNAATDEDPATLPAISAGVTQRLDPGMTTTQVVAILAAGTVITGALYFGSNGVLDSAGLTITQLDGRKTYFHADGSGNQLIGQAILESLIATGNVSIFGQNNVLAGLMTLLTGVSDPTAKAGVTAAGWDYVSQTSGADYGLTPRGLFDNGTTWIYTGHFTTGQVHSITKSTGAHVLLKTMPTGFNATGGGVKVGTSWYVLGQDANRGNDWYVYVYDASWNKTGEWAPSGASGDLLALGVDGSGLLITKRTVADNLYVSNYTTAGVESAAVLCGTWPSAVVTGVVKAAVDTATVRFVVASTTGLRVFNTSTGARVTAEEWTPAAGPLGISYDGSNWWTLDMAKVWKYTNLIGTYDFAFDWEDNDAGGSGTARTKVSPLFTVAPTKRAKWTISLPTVPPDDGTSDGADQAGVYAAPTGNTLVRQAILTTTPWSATFGTLATSGTAPASTNGFASRPGAVGRWASQAVDGSGNPLIDIRGDGTYVLPVKMFRAHKTADQTSIASSSSFDTKVTFPTTDYNNLTNVSVSESGAAFTVAQAGAYDIDVGLAYAQNSSGRRAIALTVNQSSSGFAGTSAAVLFGDNRAAAPAGPTTLSATLKGQRLAAGDVIRVWTCQSAGVALDISAQNYGPAAISIVKVAA